MTNRDEAEPRQIETPKKEYLVTFARPSLGDGTRYSVTVMAFDALDAWERVRDAEEPNRIRLVGSIAVETC